MCRKPGPVWDRQLLRPVLKTVEFSNFDKRVTAVALLDTGAGETVLPVDMARELGLNVRNLSIKGKAVATYFTIMWAMLHSARILGTKCEAGPMPVIITPHASGPIIGARFLSQAGLVFDFDEDGEVRCK